MNPLLALTALTSDIHNSVESNKHHLSINSTQHTAHSTQHTHTAHSTQHTAHSTQHRPELDGVKGEIEFDDACGPGAAAEDVLFRRHVLRAADALNVLRQAVKIDLGFHYSFGFVLCSLIHMYSDYNEREMTRIKEGMNKKEEEEEEAY